jgi:hypothetical protein
LINRPISNRQGCCTSSQNSGILDFITISGNSAKVETVKDGFDGPVSLVQVGDVAYVLDDPLRYLFDPELSKKPGPPVRAIPVKLPAAK